MKAELKGPPSPISLPGPSLFTTAQSSITGALHGCLGSLDGACIEKLLLHCAAALESNDATLAQQVMWVLNNVASTTGDPNQRIASCFLRALVARTARLFPAAAATAGLLPASPVRPMSVTELAGYVDLIPWHRFGYSATNGAICRAVRGKSRIHIIDFTTTHCMQWPTLIDALAKTASGSSPAPALRITVAGVRPPVPPFLSAPICEVGLRLANFAKSREVPFEFHVIPFPANNDEDDEVDINISSESKDDLLLTQLDPFHLHLRDDELLIVNCQSWLRYLSDEPRPTSPSTRDAFISLIRSLNPALVLAVDEDVDLGYSATLATRIAACFNYAWIPFDALETFLPRESELRMGYEADVGHKIENVVGFERGRRIERPEAAGRAAERMRRAGFVGWPFCEETVGEVKTLLEEHAGGWGMKREEDGLVLTWKGHNAVFATAWIPATTTTMACFAD